ncbi:PREDICTED: protein BREAST CANCER SUSCEPTIBILITY 2 homolog B-like isoform X2 [Nelumbo nucifera]|uniref:Protein BREAST CANCER SUSCEPTIBILITY 2 homolog B-like isoform X2 n=1 Tax=Nelumbo nucifera TaxID=4432 RepID=A0A1U8Q3T0_NELNU|nr:PREDICTED: protein BREAST CANCER SUSCEPTIBILITY 2 homolog B-like isoform X2 [Nelumbo nucifera]
MVTWQMFSDAENSFRWEMSGQSPATVAEERRIPLIHRDNPSSRLPSMEDLLVQGSSKFIESGGGADQKSPMFRTGFGKSVAVKQSSIIKALSVLGEGDETDRGEVLAADDGCGFSNSLFQTGSGKMVNISSFGLVKAKTLFGLEESYNCCTSQAPEQTRKQPTAGQSFASRNLSHLEKRSGEVCAPDGKHSFSNSLFQTGSGKMVNISSAGLSRAKTLLGLEESYNSCTSQGLEHTSRQSTTNETCSSESLLHFDKRSDVYSDSKQAARLLPEHLIGCRNDIILAGSEPKKDIVQNLLQPDICEAACKPPPIKFQTAGGRSISVSSDALQRAKSLLGDPELGNLSNHIDNNQQFLFFKEKRFNEVSSNNENNLFASCLQQNVAMNKHTSKNLQSLARFSNHMQSFAVLEGGHLGGNLPKQVESSGSACEDTCWPNTNISCNQKPSSWECSACYTTTKISLSKDIESRNASLGMLPCGPLVDISNMGPTYSNQKHIPSEKRRLGRRSSISPFKRPRNSRFAPPLSGTFSVFPNGSSVFPKSQGSSCKTRVSARYPFHIKRMSVKEFFGGPPCFQPLLEQVPDEVKCMNADGAEKYIFHDKSGLGATGAEAFFHMLSQSGASMIHASKEWVANHYKWIIWKLACYERGYPAKASGKYLTVSNVLEELKYRYEREVNHGHRSALKRILEGDAPPASMVVLCISAIRCYPNLKLGNECVMASCEEIKKLSGSNSVNNNSVAKIELTDGWYSLDALLDVPLSKQLVSGKLFVGQKLRIWGASLCGWIGPVSPLECSKMVCLQLHINGTYRTHWADRLGFCKGHGTPLAFRCIKSGGGLVPRTLVGVVRIYPVLYKERLKNGGSVVRSERMETKVLQLYNQRRANIAEGVMSEFQKNTTCFHSKSDKDNEEGAKILKILETAAEPEIIMADMTSEQLTSFATYQAKQEAIRQSDMQKKIEKALEDAGLGSREVTPLMRVRVVGLNSKCSQRKGCLREGLITIWNPTEKQFELVEGQAYTIGGLTPLNSDSDTIYLHARGPSTSWQLLPPSAVENFEPFFVPRNSVFLSNLGEVPLSSEFDIAAVVVHVGEIYISGNQKKQWVFVTDGSVSGFALHSEGASDCLLAISFCSPVVDNDSFAPINYNLTGSTVGFCNLVKRARDEINNLWVAETTENSTYTFNYDLPGCSHLKEAAGSACKWAKISSLTIQKLQERVLFIVGDHKN